MRTFFNSELGELAALAAKLNATMEGDEGEQDSSTLLQEGLGQFFDKNVSGTASSDDEESAGDDSSGADDEGEEKDEEESSDDDADESTDDDDDEEEESDEGEEGDEEEDASDEEEDEESDEEDDEPSEFDRAAARGKLPMEFSDILKSLPKEARGKARQAFEKRLGQMEAGFTRTMQQASSFRKERAELTSELKWIKENPIDFMWELFEDSKTGADLIKRWDEEIEARQDPNAKGFAKEAAMRRERTKNDAKQTAEKEATQADHRQARADHVEGLADKLCRRAGIDYKDSGVEEALYIAIVNDPNRDITDASIRAIVERKAAAWRKITGEKKREQRTQWVKDKVAERNKGKKRITARDQGHMPAPGKKDESKLTLEQKMLRSVARIAPDMPEG
ncbi:MAG TPA: hypothetical protein VJO33_17170 [Gemmatimonadaceae bacterium]|nr:hypothetical protein [Gemmatimonadaceae bacterium]